MDYCNLCDILYQLFTLLLYEREGAHVSFVRQRDVKFSRESTPCHCKSLMKTECLARCHRIYSSDSGQSLILSSPVHSGLNIRFTQICLERNVLLYLSARRTQTNNVLNALFNPLQSFQLLNM